MSDQYTGAGGIYPAGSFYNALAERLSTLEVTVGTSLGAVSAAEQAEAAAQAANEAATNAQQTLDTVIASTATIAEQAAEAAEAQVASSAADALAAAQAAALEAEQAAAAAGMFDPYNYYPKVATDQKLTDLSGAVVHKDGSALSGGFTAVSKNLGSSPASLTLSPSGGNIQHLTNSGVASINAPTEAGVYTLILEIVNGATAGAVTLSGFTLIDGDTLSTIAGHKFQIHVAKTNSAVVAIVKALQ